MWIAAGETPALLVYSRTTHLRSTPRHQPSHSTHPVCPKKGKGNSPPIQIPSIAGLSSTSSPLPTYSPPASTSTQRDRCSLPLPPAPHHRAQGRPRGAPVALLPRPRPPIPSQCSGSRLASAAAAAPPSATSLLPPLFTPVNHSLRLRRRHRSLITNTLRCWHCSWARSPWWHAIGGTRGVVVLPYMFQLSMVSPEAGSSLTPKRIMLVHGTLSLQPKWMGGPPTCRCPGCQHSHLEMPTLFSESSRNVVLY